VCEKEKGKKNRESVRDKKKQQGMQLIPVSPPKPRTARSTPASSRLFASCLPAFPAAIICLCPIGPHPVLPCYFCLLLSSLFSFLIPLPVHAVMPALFVLIWWWLRLSRRVRPAGQLPVLQTNGFPLMARAIAADRLPAHPSSIITVSADSSCSASLLTLEPLLAPAPNHACPNGPTQPSLTGIALAPSRCLPPRPLQNLSPLHSVHPHSRLV